MTSEGFPAAPGLLGSSPKTDAASIRVLVLHGPNLNLLGEREPHIYGTMTMSALNALCQERGAALGLEVRCEHYNGEGELINALHQARAWAQGVVFNPAGYSHTSVALRDAVAAVELPTIEVHLSNPAARESFRHADLIAPVASGIIAGFGAHSYVLALTELARRLVTPLPPDAP